MCSERNENFSSEQCSPDFNSVQQIDIQSQKSIIACAYSFPKANKLCFTYGFSSTCTSLASLLNRIVPLAHLTKLVFHCKRLCFKKIIDLLDCTPHVQTLVFRSMPWFRRSYLSIEQSEKFRRIAETNVITHITYSDECGMDEVKLLVSLCSRVQHLSVRLDRRSGESIIRFLISRTNPNTSHLCALCIRISGKFWYKRLDHLLESERLLDDYTLRMIDSELYLWW